ncbi:glutathione transferase GstA [Massilia norwichensis]|uniref:Glutathione transferase GstA n=1 Tax=Massilia norwichensis TaxID=1442366 RepID=A0ABT2A2T0_9BURK|nr:glutathione transferase GstA [Massilia norwichensis]MCS0588501.1 glutathione transferase GstA [Massilia norwichensis]
MKLYFSPGACSLASHIALIEAGLEFTTERVDIRARKTASGADFLAINSKGYVPALELKDGAVLTEGPAILQFIADLAPDRQLAPANGTLERYRLIEWLNFIATEVHKSFSPLFRPTSTEDMKETARTHLGNRLGWIAGQLEGRDYLMGSQFTVADAYLFTVLGWANFVQFDLSPWPVLAAYTQRVAARPAVQQALRDEGLIK